MNILYFGKIVDEELHIEDEQVRKNPYRTAQYSYEKAFCDEMCKKNKMDIISIYQKKNFPSESILFSRKKRKFNNTEIKYIRYINIPFIKESCFFIITCIKIIIWKCKNKDNKMSKYIYTNTHYPPVSLGIILMGKLLKIKRVITFTDLSLFTYSEDRIGKMPIYKKIIIRPYIKLVNKLQESYDVYILFSKTMNEIVNKKKKPYLVMEGIYNPDNISINEKTTKKKAIAHAGTLNKEVGIEKILKVFSKIEDPNLELWLMGKGDMDSSIEEAAKKDRRIKFFGFMKKEEVFKKLKQAMLLINLRNPEDLYTKYSFPSKTFEYMVSGTPFLTTKLKGIPEEYYDFLYTIDSFDNDRIVDKISSILNKGQKELDTFGENARKFILENKNSEKQIDKIIKFIESLE